MIMPPTVASFDLQLPAVGVAVRLAVIGGEQAKSFMSDVLTSSRAPLGEDHMALDRVQHRQVRYHKATSRET